MPVVAYIVLAVLVGGGVSVVSQGALPGQLLYPVKIHVNESIKQSLAFSVKTKADVDAELAIKRLEEAEAVAAKSHLSAKLRAQVEANFKEHADRVEARMKEMVDVDARASADLMSNFETSLKAHERILAELKAKADNADEEKEIEGLSASVKVEHQDAVKAGNEADAKVSTGASADVRAAAEGKMNAAQNKIDEVQKYFDAKKAGMSAVVTSAAEARLALARHHFAEGNVELQAKAYAKAFMHFTEAHQAAQEAKLLLDANMRFNVEVKGTEAESGSANMRTNVKVTAPPVKVDGSAGVHLNY